MKYFFQLVESETQKKWDLGYYQTRKELADELIKANPSEEKRIRDLVEFRVDQVETPNRRMVSFIKEMKKEYSIYLLSNLGKEDMEQVKEMEFFSLFDGAVFSCEVGIMKPDEGIYRQLFNQYQLDPKECIFVDDSKKNVDAAIALGMHGVQKVSTSQALRDVKGIIDYEKQKQC